MPNVVALVKLISLVARLLGDDLDITGGAFEDGSKMSQHWRVVEYKEHTRTQKKNIDRQIK